MGHLPNYNVVVPAPLIEKRWICIADRGAVTLAAVVSSYLFEHGTYPPLFAFPAVIAPKTETDDVRSEIYLSNVMSSSAATLINNAWARMHGSRYLVLAGLSADQVSYLSIPKGVEVINIPARLRTLTRNNWGAPLLTVFRLLPFGIHRPFFITKIPYAHHRHPIRQM